MLSRSDLNDMIAQIASSYGVDPKVVSAIVQIESGGNPTAGTGSYKGLLQLSPGEFEKYGGSGSIFNPRQNLEAGIASLADKSSNFQKQFGRAPNATELYLMHQQGEGGLRSQLSNPDAPAWKNMHSTAEGQQKGEAWAKKAIWGNIPDSAKSQFGSVDNVTGRDFVGLWDNRIQRGLGQSPEQSIWANSQPFSPQQAQFSQGTPPSIWDTVPGIAKDGGTSTASAAPSLPSANPDDIYKSLSAAITGGGVAPAQAALPPPASPMGGPSFNDRFSPPEPQAPNPYSPASVFNTQQTANPFGQVMQKASGLQPWQVADISKYGAPPPVALPQIDVAPRLPAPRNVSQPPSVAQNVGQMPGVPMPMARPSSDIFAQNVYSTNPTMGPYTTPQDFNLQEQAMKTGYAPWAPQFGSQGGGGIGSPLNGTGLPRVFASSADQAMLNANVPMSPERANAIYDAYKRVGGGTDVSNSPWVRNANAGLFGQNDGPLSQIANDMFGGKGGPLSQLLEGLRKLTPSPIDASVKPTVDSSAMAKSMNAGVPDAGINGIQQDAASKIAGPQAMQSPFANSPFASLFPDMNNMFGNSGLGALFGGMPLDLSPPLDLGSFSSPSSMDFGFIG